jgi:hypothetical protein
MKQRFAFDQIANVYSAARPDCPEALNEDVVSYADLKQSDRILEVARGYGQCARPCESRRAIEAPAEISRPAQKAAEMGRFPTDMLRLVRCAVCAFLV